MGIIVLAASSGLFFIGAWGSQLDANRSKRFHEDDQTSIVIRDALLVAGAMTALIALTWLAIFVAGVA